MATPTGKWPQIVVGRLIAGFGVGALSILVPLFQSENAPSHIRGATVWYVTQNRPETLNKLITLKRISAVHHAWYPDCLRHQLWHEHDTKQSFMADHYGGWLCVGTGSGAWNSHVLGESQLRLQQRSA